VVLGNSNVIVANYWIDRLADVYSPIAQ
jgi:hypothetical protein